MKSKSSIPFEIRAVVAAVACAFTFAGCATTQQSLVRNDGKDEATVFASDKPRALQPFYRQLYRDGEWNATLNFNMLGLAAMQEGEFAVARKAFDQAILRIDQVYADDPNARQALSMFAEEKVKDFKGEPYERAMAYFYRGLLFLHEGDYQNARAAFLGADLQGTMSERERFAGDFGLMKYLAGWASTCEGETARGKALIEEAKRSDPKIATLPDTPGKAMLLIDSGVAPRKVGKGEHKEMMSFEPGGTPDLGIVVSGPKAFETRQLALGGDLFAQASTRGGRQIDVVLNGKAKFKDDTDKAGDAAVDVGMAMMANSYSNHRVGAAGAIIGLIGLVAKGVAAATTPAADLRAWSSLPASVMLYTANAEPGHPVMMASDASAQAALPIQAIHNGCWIGWGRTRSALPVTAGGTAELVDLDVQTSNREEKNAKLRASLMTDFAVESTPATRASSLRLPANGLQQVSDKTGGANAN